MRIFLYMAAVLATLNQSAIASKAAVDYLGSQPTSMFEFGMYRLNEYYRDTVSEILSEKNARGFGAAYYDTDNDRLVLGTQVFETGDFTSAKDTCWAIISETRRGFGIRGGKNLFGDKNSLMSLQFMFDGGKQTEKGVEHLAKLENNTVIQCTISGKGSNLARWGKLLSKSWQKGVYSD